jgi:hypothetical protein
VKTLDENRWLLIRGLFSARDRFSSLFRAYERRVLRHSRRAEVDRRYLRLDWSELRELIDFHSLEKLRDEHLHELKEVAHDLFRSEDSTDPLDSLIAQIYHEISILKEEHYTLKEDHLAKDAEAYGRLYREVKEYYPNRLRHIRGLFDKARRRLERILPTLVEGSIVVRSLYLFGPELFRSAYRDGLAGLYRKAYPEGGEARGYLEAARSFRRAGFQDHARQSLAMAESVLAQTEDEVPELREEVRTEAAAQTAATAAAIAKSPEMKARSAG